MQTAHREIYIKYFSLTPYADMCRKKSNKGIKLKVNVKCAATFFVIFVVC
jgi:hypothetical protein